MKVTILCPLLLATVTLVFGEGGAISVFNNATYSPDITIYYIRQDGSEENFETDVVSDIKPGEIKTIAFPEGYKGYEFRINVGETLRNRKVVFWALDMSIPIKMCFKTWGTADNPEIGQTDCRPTGAHALLSGDGAAISVTNSATYRSEINLRYGLRDAQGKKKQHKEAPTPINPGETKTIAIPKGAEEVDFDIVHPKTNSESLFTAKFSKPVKLCLKIRGTADDPKSGQTDC